MMRQILALVLILALAPLAHADGKKHKRLGEMKTTQDNWDELMSDNQLEDDKPKREVVRARPGAYAMPKAQTRPAATRAPASVPPMQMKPASAFPVAAITFDEYLAENARNPALSKIIPDHQLAFQDTVGIATIPLDGDNGNGAAQPANGAAGAANAAAANPAAIQAAAAAAAAAGLIPAGASLPGMVGGSAPASGTVGGGNAPPPIR